MSRHHIMMKVSTVLEMLGNKREANQLTRMFNMDTAEIRKQCEDLIASGRVFIPTEGCDNFDATGKCLGHEEGGKL